MGTSRSIRFINIILKQTNGESLTKTFPLRQTKYFAATFTTRSQFWYSMQETICKSLVCLTSRRCMNTDKASLGKVLLGSILWPDKGRIGVTCLTRIIPFIFMKCNPGIGISSLTDKKFLYFKLS